MNQWHVVNSKKIEKIISIFPVIYNFYLGIRTDEKALISNYLLRSLVLLSSGDCLRTDPNH